MRYLVPLARQEAEYLLFSGCHHDPPLADWHALRLLLHFLQLSAKTGDVEEFIWSQDTHYGAYVTSQTHM